MHWNSGRFHGPVTIENMYISDKKFNAIKCYMVDNDSKIYFGDESADSFLTGNSVEIFTSGRVDITSENDEINMNSVNKINIISNSSNVNVESGNNINIKSTNAIIFDTNKLLLTDKSYGTKLPTTNLSVGRIFFKLIS